jgi:Tol biopolymer transport system component
LNTRRWATPISICCRWQRRESPRWYFRATKFNEGRSNFSPDSRLIAYRSNESGRFEVYVEALAPNGGRWQISTAGGEEPSWRGDGKELYYVSAKDELMAVDIERTGDSVRAGPPRKLFSVSRMPARRNRLVHSHDGKRFLVVMAEPEKKPEAPIVVLNWPALI